MATITRSQPVSTVHSRPDRSLPGRLQPSVALASVLVAGAACAFGFVAYFARGLGEAGLASSSVAFFRYAVTAAVTAPFLALGGSKRRATAWAVASGLAMGFGWVAYVEAVRSIDVATVGVIYMTYPLFTLAIAWLLFGLRPSRRSLLAGALVAVAGTVAISPGGLGSGDPGTLLTAFLAPLTFGAAIAVLTERLGSLDPLERVAGASIGAVLGLLPVLAGEPIAAIFPSAATDWLLVLGIAVGTSLLPMTVYAVAAPIVGASRTASAGALELPTVFLIGWWLLGEPLTRLHLAAGVLIVVAIAVSPRRQPALASADAGRGVRLTQAVPREHDLPQLQVASPEPAG